MTNPSVSGEGSLLPLLHKAVADANIYGQKYSLKEQQDEMLKALVLAVADWLQAYSKPGKPGKDGCGWWVAKQLRQEVEG